MNAQRVDKIDLYGRIKKKENFYQWKHKEKLGLSLQKLFSCIANLILKNQLLIIKAASLLKKLMIIL